MHKTAAIHARPAASIGRAIRRRGGSIIGAESLSLLETQEANRGSTARANIIPGFIR
jgi:hypothetical protein